MFRKLHFLMDAADDGTGGAGGAGSEISVADARGVLADFVSDPKSLDTMPDADILAYHGRVMTGVGKHAPKHSPDGKGPWYGGFKDKDVMKWVETYGKAYPDPEAMALKAWNLEKFVGAEKAGRGIVLPKADAKDEEWLPIMRKLGAPEKVDGYKLPKELADDPAAMRMRDMAFKMGMPSRMFDGLMGHIGTELKTIGDAQFKEFEAKSKAELDATLAEWGTNVDAKQEAGRRAAAQFIPHNNKEELQATLTRMEGALGTGFMMKFWASIGEAIGEHGRVNEEDGQTSVSTPAGARLRIAELKKDAGFAKKLLDGDVDAKAEWDKLHKLGHGSAPQ